MNFTKVQGAGNDFVLVEASEVVLEWPQLAVAMCDRHYGIGADGLLVLLPSSQADFRMRMFNPDGSEAEACGNGLRCLVGYIVDRELTGDRAGGISIETMAGIRQVRIFRSKGRLVKIQVGMGRPQFAAEDIPVAIEPEGEELVDIKLLSYPISVGNRELFLHPVSMGNPHAVYFWQHPVSEFPLSRLGPEVERHKMFPDRTNFEVAHVVSRQQIEARVWERGAGETLACGSGACAVAVAARLLDYVDNKVEIKLPGGILEVEWDKVGEVLLSGPADIVFSGEWSR